MFFVRYLVLLCFVCGPTLGASELRLHGASGTKSLSRAELLVHPKVETLAIALLNYPGQNLSVKAIPLWYLLEAVGAHTSSAMRFRCLDGYSGLLDTSYLVAQGVDQASAYIAIEDPKNPWPALPKESNLEGLSAGPFYLVWKDPERSSIPPEYWPYQLASLEAIASLDGLFSEDAAGRLARFISSS